jgi:hypothetical protein
MILVRLDFDTSAKDYVRHRRLVAFELVEVEQMDLGNALEV